MFCVVVLGLTVESGLSKGLACLPLLTRAFFLFPFLSISISLSIYNSTLMITCIHVLCEYYSGDCCIFTACN